MARVLFIQPVLPQEMLGLMYLSTALKRAGHETKALFLPEIDWLAKLERFDPDVVAYSFTTGMQDRILAINAEVKERCPSVRTVLGGPHPTFVPDMVREEGVDAVCRGEGELALVEFCDRLDRGQSVNDCPNFWVKDGSGAIHRNGPRPMVMDLESLGFPDRELVYEAAPMYRDAERKVVATLRGCPMDCSFCFHHAWRDRLYEVSKGSYVRKRSVSHVIEEVARLKARYPLKFVHFVDDIFNISTVWMREFADRWPKEIGLPFDVILMANMTTEEQVGHLKRAGCVYARIAIEAANDEVRNKVLRKNTARRHLTDAARWIKAAGIRLGSLNMLGAPSTTLADDLDTLKLNIECRVDHPLVSLTQPYPDTDLASMSAGMGLATAKLEELPEKFNRKASFHVPDRKAVERLHKLFPLAVRWPFLRPFVRFLIRVPFSANVYFVVYALFTEYLVSEQNSLYRRRLGERGPSTWPFVDFLKRTTGKIFWRSLETVSRKRHVKKRVSLLLGDERIVAHAD